MFADLLPYLLLLVVGATAVLLLTSKALAEKLVGLGMMPRAFLGLIPLLRTMIRAFGCVLILGGILKIGIDAGLVNAEILSRYSFPAALILLGMIMLVAAFRDH
jgi:hypothetical protein